MNVDKGRISLRILADKGGVVLCGVGKHTLLKKNIM